MNKFTDNYSSANRNQYSRIVSAKAHDRRLIEDSFHSGIASTDEVERLFNKYGIKK